jgi:DinB superfamily
MNVQITYATALPRPVASLARLLEELEVLLIGVDPAVYGARFAPGISGSIGEHVRHCLDHVTALLSANPAVTLSYDRRHRGTAVETDSSAAIRQIAECRRVLDSWSSRSIDEPIRVSSLISAAGETVIGWSTLGRELAFVLSHTIHHQALIALLLAIRGLDVPDRFGYAPSTPRVN